MKEWNKMGAYEMGYFIGLIVGSIGMGIVMGLIPFFIAKKNGRKDLGMIGIVICVFANFLSGIYLSIPACIAYSIAMVIVTRKKKQDLIFTEQNEETTLSMENQNPSWNQQQNDAYHFQNQDISNGDASWKPAFCQFCGAELNGTGLFCPKCGNRIKQ